MQKEEQVAEVVTAGERPHPEDRLRHVSDARGACAEIVAEALRVGFRHVDTAQGYDNEAAVGEGIRASGVPRERYSSPPRCGRSSSRDGALQRSVEESLKRLKIDVIDLLLIHWPNPEVPVAESMRALSAAKRARPDARNRRLEFHHRQARRGDRGLAPSRSSQCSSNTIPISTRRGFLRRLAGTGLRSPPIARSRSARWRAIPPRSAIGKKHGKSAVQVTLRWLIQQDDVIAIPKTSKPERLKENLDVFDFRLTDEEMDQISRMTVPNSRLINEPLWVPHWD